MRTGWKHMWIAPIPFLAAPFLAIALMACSPQAAEAERATAPVAAAEAQAGVHPVSGLEVIPVTIALQGRSHVVRAEVARTDRQQAQGLMQRTAMGADEGMLFPYPQPRMLSFWMKNTVLSLDIIYIGPDGKVVNVIANAEPMNERQLWSDAPASAVLELNAGRAAALGIGPGTAISW
jgi:uncharacterized membrane protein (UPF0127 family)